MRESVRAFERRTGLRYAPARELRALGRPLPRDTACPTLFRYPGPCGLKALFCGHLAELGRPGGPLLFMASWPLHADVRGARHFGTVAVLEPLRALPVRTPRRGIHIGLNLAPPDLGGLVWVPPCQFGPGLAAERARVVERLHAYLEELSMLDRAGAPPPPRAWCELPRSERARRLAQAGVTPTWSLCHDRARA